MFRRLFSQWSSSNSTTTRTNIPVEHAEIVYSKEDDTLIPRGIYNELKEGHEALQKQHEALQKERDGFKEAFEMLTDIHDADIKRCRAYHMLITNMLAFLKGLEPSHVKGAMKWKEQRDVLVKRVEQTLKGEASDEAH